MLENAPDVYEKGRKSARETDPEQFKELYAKIGELTVERDFQALGPVMKRALVAKTTCSCLSHDCAVYYPCRALRFTTKPKAKTIIIWSL